MTAQCPQFRCPATQCHGAAVRIQEALVRVAGRAHGVRRQRQVAGGQSFVGLKISGVLLSRLSKACKGFFESFASAALPEMPALSDEIFGSGHIQPIAHLRAMDDPEAKFL